MKKTISLVSLLLMTCIATAQISRPEYERFIEKPSIQWAGYITDTVRFSGTNLPAMLAQRFSRGEIKITHGLATDPKKTKFISKKQLSDYYESLSNHPLFDAVGNLNPAYFTDAGASTRFDALSHNLAFIPQLFFIRKGKPFVYIPWISPSISMYTPSNLLLGTGEFFSTGFNSSSSNKKPSRAIFIMRTRREFSTDSLPFSRLKIVYGMEFIQALWPSITKGKFKMTAIKSQRSIGPRELTYRLVDSLRIPQVESAETTKGVLAASPPLDPGNVSKMVIWQDWYYDKKKNRVYAPLAEADIYFNTWRDSGMKSIPVLKIHFN